jgi:hypothetical protein
MTEQQVQNITAFLGLARNAIDNAELRIVGLPESRAPRHPLITAISEIHAAASNLVSASELINEYARSIAEKPKDASTVDGVAAGTPLVP